MLGLENLIPKFGMDGTTSGPIFLLVRRANAAGKFLQVENVMWQVLIIQC